MSRVAVSNRVAKSNRATLVTAQNMLTRSELFSNAAWVSSGFTTLTSGQADPFGNVGAFKLNDTSEGAAQYHYISTSDYLMKTGITITFSCYAKAGTKQYLLLEDGSNGQGTCFDLLNGVVGAMSTGFGNIYSVGNGWYRCEVVITPPSTSNGHTVAIALNTTNSGVTNQYQGDGTGNIYIFGAQVTESNWAGFYTKTTGTAVNTGGIRGKISLENFVRQSEDFNTTWTKQTNVTVTSNQAIAPDGTLTADLIDFTTASGGSGIFIVSQNLIKGLQNTKSIYLKGVLGTEVVTLNDPSQSVGSTTCNLTTYWKRFSLTDAVGSQPNAGGVYVSKSSGNQFYAWGAQLNRGNAPGIYVKTTTVEVAQNGIRQSP